VINKYLIILCFIWCFILTGCVTEEQHMATPTVKHLTTSQIKDYVCTGEYDLKQGHEAFTVDSEGNFYLTYYSDDSHRINIKKYNFQGKYITGWVSERKKTPYDYNGEVEVADILADKENIYLIYGEAYNSYMLNIDDGVSYCDYNSYIEKFDLNGKFITVIETKKDSDVREFVRHLTKDKNGNFYLASRRHIEKYDSNWKLQSILYPFAKKWYEKGSNFTDNALIGDLAVDSVGYIYILLKWWGSDVNGYFAKFDSSGKLIKEWISDDKDKFYFCALEIDHDDNIYVLAIDKTDTYNIRKFDSSGNFITEWNSEDKGDIYASSYTDIKIDSKGNVYVDSGNGTIKKFSPKQ